RNKIGGLHRKHGQFLDLMCTDLDGMHNVTATVENGSCHFGKEATVAAIAALSADRYHTFPVLISPTCKTETSPDQAKFIQLIISRWKPAAHGENNTNPSGPSQSQVTDMLLVTSRASPFQCKRLFILLIFCMESFEGYRDLTDRQTGKDEVTMDSDPKHLMNATVHSSARQRVSSSRVQ
ncbi:hypothetical protein BD410DRAFT_734437, partial [Rickenella mellea]